MRIRVAPHTPPNEAWSFPPDAELGSDSDQLMATWLAALVTTDRCVPAGPRAPLRKVESQSMTTRTVCPPVEIQLMRMALPPHQRGGLPPGALPPGGLEYVAVLIRALVACNTELVPVRVPTASVSVGGVSDATLVDQVTVLVPATSEN